MADRGVLMAKKAFMIKLSYDYSRREVNLDPMSFRRLEFETEKMEDYDS